MKNIHVVFILLFSFLVGWTIAAFHSQNEKLQHQIDDLKKQLNYTKTHCIPVIISGESQDYELFNPSEENDKDENEINL